MNMRLQALILALTMAFGLGTAAFAMNTENFRRSDNIQDDRGLAPKILVEHFNKDATILRLDIRKYTKSIYAQSCSPIEDAKSDLTELREQLEKAEKLEDILPAEETEDFAAEVTAREAKVTINNDADSLISSISAQDKQLEAAEKRFLKGYDPILKLAKRSKKKIGALPNGDMKCFEITSILSVDLKVFIESLTAADDYLYFARKNLKSYQNDLEDLKEGRSKESIDRMELEPEPKTEAASGIGSDTSVTGPSSTSTSMEVGSDVNGPKPASSSSDLLTKKNFEFYRDFLNTEMSK